MIMLPFLLKNSLEYFPVNMSLRGTAPSSSMIKAMWSTITQSVSSREGGGEVERRTKQWTTWSDSVNTVIHPSWEKGYEREDKETQPCPDSTDSGHTVKNFQIKDSKKNWTSVKQKRRLSLVELQAMSCHTSAALKLQQFVYCAEGRHPRQASLRTTGHLLRKKTRCDKAVLSVELLDSPLFPSDLSLRAGLYLTDRHTFPAEIFLWKFPAQSIVTGDMPQKLNNQSKVVWERQGRQRQKEKMNMEWGQETRIWAGFKKGQTQGKW